MAAHAPTSLFARLVNAWEILALRSDIDDIILNLLARFSLERIYVEGDGAKDEYTQTVITLLAQLNVIFYIQRLSFPNDNLQPGWYLNYVASWEVIIRSVELVLQAVGDGRDALYEAPLLIEKYLAEMLLSALRILALHPKVPNFASSKERRERFARVHRLLERVCDSYAGPHSFLLLVCRATTDSLRTENDALILPTSLGRGLPNLAFDLYPVPDCLSPQAISEIIQPDFGDNWLSQLLALRDVAHFVVGASIQYVVKSPPHQRLQLHAASAKSRTAIDAALDKIRLPSSLKKEDARDSFNDIYRIILPSTGAPVRRGASTTHSHEVEIDAIADLYKKLTERQIVHRASDRSMTHFISEITRNIALLDDETVLVHKPHPRMFIVNCPAYHLMGESQLQSIGALELPSALAENHEVELPPKFKCSQCDEIITTMRYTTLARYVRELLPPPSCNSVTISLERHQSGQFQVSPPKHEAVLAARPDYNFSTGGQRSLHVGSDVHHPGQDFPSPISPGHHRPPFQPLNDLSSPALSPDIVESARKGFFQETRAQTNGKFKDSRSQAQEASRKLSDTITEPLTSSNITTVVPVTQAQAIRTGSNASLENTNIHRSSTVSSVPAAEKKSKWRFIPGKREPVATVMETSSLSSTTLESQRLDEVSLKGLLDASKKGAMRGKSAKHVSVSLSQNSSHAMFWTAAAIHLWDVSTCPPTFVLEERTESTCIVAAVTKAYLAYIIGTRDQRLTLRIVNLLEPSVASFEYRMHATVFPTSIVISPKEDYVVVGFEKSIVRFFSTFRTTSAEGTREDRLHIRDQSSHKVETLSFSNDGHVLLCSTRSDRSGTIHIFSWRSPFVSYQELKQCLYQVPPHESEDNGVSSALFRPGRTAEDDLICVTTWTQSGVPLLFQPESGHKSEIKPETSSRQGKLGSRVHSAAFSPSGRMLAMVNDKGQLYKISRLNSNPMSVRRVSDSKALKSKSEAFAMAFMSLPDEEAIVMAWPDPSKGIGYVKKIPIAAAEDHGCPDTPGSVWVALQELPAEGGDLRAVHAPVELAGDRTSRSDMSKGKGIDRY